MLLNTINFLLALPAAIASTNKFDADRISIYSHKKANFAKTYDKKPSITTNQLLGDGVGIF